LHISVTSLFRPSQNIEHDMIETANMSGYDMLLMGIGHGVFEGTILGKVLGITNKIISPVRLYDSITGKEKLFSTDIFDERTSHIIKSVKVPVAIFIEKNFTEIETVFIPLFSREDQFLLQFAAKILSGNAGRITIMDPSGLIDLHPEIKETINSMELLAPGQLNLHSEKALEREFLQQQNLMMISYESWKKAVESHSIWLSNSPSVLIIRG